MKAHALTVHALDSLGRIGQFVPPLPIALRRIIMPGVCVNRNRAAETQLLYFTDFP